VALGGEAGTEKPGASFSLRELSARVALRRSDETLGAATAETSHRGDRDRRGENRPSRSGSCDLHPETRTRSRPRCGLWLHRSGAGVARAGERLVADLTSGWRARRQADRRSGRRFAGVQGEVRLQNASGASKGAAQAVRPPSRRLDGAW